MDDEKASLNLLHIYIHRYCPNIEIVGTARNIEEAKDKIIETSPHVLFLDIQMDDKIVFELLDSINYGEYEIVFVTAYEEFARKAFKYHAIDYLLKPLVIDELIETSNRLFLRIEERKVFEAYYNTPEKIKSKSSSYISIPSLEKVDVLKKDDIVFLKSDGRYTTFCLKNKSEIVASKNIGEYETLLDSDVFFRIHHSYIINIAHLLSVSRKNGAYCYMVNNIILPVSKRKQEALNSFLKINS